MIDKASAVAAPVQRSHWTNMAALAFVLVVVITAGVAGAPYLFEGASLQSELATQVRATTGLIVTSADRGRFDLLPRPHIVIKGLHFADPTGTLAIDADALDGEVRLLPLLVGRLELASATMAHPKLAIDLDGRPMPPDSMIGRALHDPTPSSQAPDRRLGVVTLVDGTVTLKSKTLNHVLAFDHVDVTIDWPDLDSPATVTGSVTVQKTPASIAVWLAQPASLMRGEQSPLALRLEGTPIDLSANGDLTTTGLLSFRGHVSLRAPSLPALFAFAGRHVSAPAPFANLVLNSDTSIGRDLDGRTAVDLPNLNLRLDGNEYEGTLAFQSGPVPTLSGTLATEQLLMAPFLDHAPRLTDAAHRWTRDPIVLMGSDPIDLDLRISATHLRLAPFAIDDAAMAVITRNDRTEVALVDGKAYGGDIRGRVSIGLTGDTLSVRGTGSLAGADLGTLTWDGFGRPVAIGTMSGSTSLETSGESPASLMQHLTGWAKVHANDGEIAGIDLGRSLRELAEKRSEPGLPVIHVGRTPFQSLSLSLQLADGVADIDEGSMTGTDAVVAMTGQSNVGTRGLDLHMVAAPLASPREATTSPGAPTLRLNIEGSYNKVLVAPDRSGPASSGHAAEDKAPSLNPQ